MGLTRGIGSDHSLTSLISTLLPTTDTYHPLH